MLRNLEPPGESLEEGNRMRIMIGLAVVLFACGTFTLAQSDDRELDENGRCRTPAANTFDVETASWTHTIPIWYTP